MMSQSSAADWCNAPDTPFSRRAPGVCDYFDQQQSRIGSVRAQASGGQVKTVMPRFYAEIDLAATSENHGLIPTSVLYYYPDGTHSGFKGNKRRRSVIITVSAKKISGDTEALSPVVALLKDLQPGKTIERVNVTAAKWSQVLANQDTPPANLPANADPVGMTAVNISAEVREIGDPSRMLQLIAEWSAGMKDPAKTAVGNAGLDKSTPAKPVKTK